VPPCASSTSSREACVSGHPAHWAGSFRMCIGGCKVVLPDDSITRRRRRETGKGYKRTVNSRGIRPGAFL
jgi:hypothetical protein